LVVRGGGQAGICVGHGHMSVTRAPRARVRAQRQIGCRPAKLGGAGALGACRSARPQHATDRHTRAAEPASSSTSACPLPAPDWRLPCSAAARAINVAGHPLNAGVTPAPGCYERSAAGAAPSTPRWLPRAQHARANTPSIYTSKRAGAGNAAAAAAAADSASTRTHHYTRVCLRCPRHA
jgi:hypothetical protein